MSLCPVYSIGDSALNRFRNRRVQPNLEISQSVAEIISRVAAEGAAALLEMAQKFDSPVQSSLFVTEEELVSAAVTDEELAAIRAAIVRITEFHETQLGVVTEGWEELSFGWGWTTTATERPGTAEDRPEAPEIDLGVFSFKTPAGAVPIPEQVESGQLGQRMLPMRRVGIYAPGGKASYPSSVLMNAIPAKVARAAEIVLATPAGPDGNVPASVLVAAREIGITKILKSGGVGAIAALALGFDGFARVDKIAGPGNVWVNEAKRQLWGSVGLDGYAGPSEVCVLAMPEADPLFAAADFLAQSEHSPDNVGLLICFSQDQAKKILDSAGVQVMTAPRSAILREALTTQSAVVVCSTLDEAVDLINDFAPEHLALLANDPDAFLPHIVNAGCITLGHFTAQAAGDYASGPSHTLPTSGAARFAGPVNVTDFLRLQSLTRLEKGDLVFLNPIIQGFATMEGFPAHGQSASIRL